MSPHGKHTYKSVDEIQLVPTNSYEASCNVT